jgi:hypothetical protein
MQGIKASKFGQFRKHVFIKFQEIFYSLLFVNHGFASCSLLKLCQADRVSIQVFDENGSTERRLVVQARTTIRMSASPNFEIKGTVHLVFLRSVNASQVFSHDGRLVFKRMGME